jgi:hypothetical protein
MANASSDQHFTLAVNIAVDAIKSLLLVNGGAVTALIALSEKTSGDLKFGDAILFFGIAALLNAGTLVIGYFSQLSYANHRLAHEDGQDGSRSATSHAILQALAVVIVLVSLIMSALGACSAYHAL